MNQNNEVPTKLHAKLITVATIGAVGGFLFGYDTSVINGAVDAIASPDSGFGLNAAMSGFSVSSAMIGCVVGAWFAGTLADRIGRVRVMQLAAALFVFSALFTGLASNIWVFVIFRIVGGLGVGFTSAIGPAYISEISPSSRRGFLTGFQQMAIALGIVAALVVNDSYLLGSGGAAVTFWAGLETWRWMLMTTAVPGVIMFALTFALPESPRYLVMKGKKAIAEKVLLEVVGDRNASATVEQIAQSLEGETQPKVSDLRGKTFGLKSVVWIGIGVALFQQVSGANVIMFYDSSLWKAVGFTESASMTIAVVRALLATAVTVLGMLIIDKVGRRAMLKVGSLIMAVLLVVVAVCFAQSTMTADGGIELPGAWAIIMIIGAYGFFLTYCATWGVAMWVVIGEIFPNRIRAVAVALATAANWIGNFLVSTTFPPLRDSLGLTWTFALYAVMAVLGYWFIAKKLPETNGVELEDMKAEI